MHTDICVLVIIGFVGFHIWFWFWFCGYLICVKRSGNICGASKVPSRDFFSPGFHTFFSSGRGGGWMGFIRFILFILFIIRIYRMAGGGEFRFHLLSLRWMMTTRTTQTTQLRCSIRHLASWVPTSRFFQSLISPVLVALIFTLSSE